MHVRSKLLFFFAVFVTLSSTAQKINNNWVFGEHAGLNFNTDPASYFSPTAATTDSQPPPNFVSAISSRFGYLQFYTDGRRVWNRKHQYILPDNWRWPWDNYTMPLICPYPDNDSLYYLFGVSPTGSHAGELLYVTINMAADYGNGAIVYPSSSYTDYYTVLQKASQPLLAGTGHCNGKDTWIVTYKEGAFQAFLLTQSGVNTDPVTSRFPSSILQPLFDFGWSNLKFSANGERMVLPVLDDNTILVFDFNNATGVFSNPRKLRLPAEKNLEDTELSSDGSKLYFGVREKLDRGLEQHNIYQMDLAAGTPAQIEKTIYRVNDRADRAGCTPHDCFFIYRSLQLGPDGKIYASMREVSGGDKDATLSVIDNVNKPAMDVIYRRNAVEVGSVYRFLNYNYIRSGSFSLKENGIAVKQKSCKDQPVEFALLISNVDSVRWDFGDPGSGTRNFSIEKTPTHQYPQAGLYNVTAYVYTNCIVDTARKQVLLQDLPAVHLPADIKDTALCNGDRLQLNVAQPSAKDYVWENNIKTPQRLIEDTGLYSIYISNECSYGFKRFHVDFITCKCVSYVPTAFTPNRDYLNDVFRPSFQCPAKAYSFRVVNRWGGTVFQSDHPNAGWNGKSKDQEAPEGIYAWMLQYTDPNTNQVITKKGTVALLR